MVGKLGRLRKSHTTCKRCYLMLLLLDYHIPSFFSKKKATLSTTNTTYVHYFVLLVFRCTVHKEIQCKKKSVVRNNATFPLLLHAITMLQKGIIGEGGERKKLQKNMKKRYASNNVRWNWRQWSCSWYLIWLLSTCTKMVEKSQISGNVPIQFAHEIASQRLAIGIISDIWLKRKADRFWKNRGHSGGTHIMAAGSLHHG